MDSTRHWPFPCGPKYYQFCDIAFQSDCANAVVGVLRVHYITVCQQVGIANVCEGLNLKLQ
jgi:hypothetical protein